MADQVPLGIDDYRQLFDMVTSGDSSIRERGSALSKKLTPTEQQEFFDFQKQAHQGEGLHREDNSVLGVPPELAVIGGLGVARAVAGAGAGIVSKTLAGGKEIVSQGTPAIKYQAVKSGLEALGLPSSISTPTALLVAGYKKGSAPPDPVHMPTAEGFEAYGNPVSVAPSAGPLAESANAVKGPPQGTFTQLADGSWGIKGSGLKAGDSVHVMNRAGNGQMLKVGQVMPDGTATIAGASEAAPKVALSARDVTRVQQLVKQGVPEKMAVDTVLKLKQPAGVSP